MENNHQKKSNNTLVVGGIMLAIALVSFLIYGGSRPSLNQSENITQIYDINDTEKPIITIEPAILSQDVGTMNVNEERTAEFALKNTGSKPLVISGLQTSCMCTFGEIIAGNRKSPRVNMEMHNSASAKSWQLKLEPNETATARVIYRPLLMPVQGPIERVFLFETNDPLRQRVELVIKAFVTP